MIGSVLALGTVALASQLPEAPPDSVGAVSVEVAGVVEEAPTVDLPLNVLGATVVVPDPLVSTPVPVPEAVTSTTAAQSTTSVVAPTTLPPATTLVAPTTDVVVPPAASTSSSLPVVSTTAAPVTREAQALALVKYDWEAVFPTLRIDFLGPRNGLRALTYPGEHRIEIFVRDSDTAASLHRVLAHELGHVIDVELNSPGDRDRWLAQRGLAASTTWWPNESAPDFATGAGDFAEAFAVWETGVQTQSTLAAQPTAADLALLIELAS